MHTGRPSQVIVSGECAYWWGNEQAFGPGKRARSWSCEFKTYSTEWPPHLTEHDFIGNPDLENWYGPRPQPFVGDRTSLHPLTIDDVELAGPGQLTIDCEARTEETATSALSSKCKIAWYSKGSPANFHYEGECGVDAVVRDDIDP